MNLRRRLTQDLERKGHLDPIHVTSIEVHALHFLCYSAIQFIHCKSHCMKAVMLNSMSSSTPCHVCTFYVIVLFNSFTVHHVVPKRSWREHQLPSF
jgi:hypothetical protein